MNIRNIGKIRITKQLIIENPKNISEILSLLEFVPIRAEYFFENDEFEYIGLSPKFEELSLGVIPPNYEIIISKINDKLNIDVKKL